MSLEEHQPRTDRYLVSWDILGLEALINISEHERESIVAILQGNEVRWQNPIQAMILRARFNSQRHYEIYVFESELSESVIRSLFDSDPHVIADTIRRIGQCLYSDRMIEKPKIV